MDFLHHGIPRRSWRESGRSRAAKTRNSTAPMITQKTCLLSWHIPTYAAKEDVSGVTTMRCGRTLIKPFVGVQRWPFRWCGDSAVGRRRRLARAGLAVDSTSAYGAIDPYAMAEPRLMRQYAMLLQCRG